jgi:hypothetical protein
MQMRVYLNMKINYNNNEDCGDEEFHCTRSVLAFVKMVMNFQLEYGMLHLRNKIPQTCKLYTTRDGLCICDNFRDDTELWKYF